MGYKTHTVDGKAGEVDLSHLRKRTLNWVGAITAAAHVIGRVPVAATVTAVRVYCTGGTSATVNASGPGGAFLAGNLTGNAGAWTSANAGQNTALAAGDSITATVVSTVGTPTEVAIQVDYTVNVP